MRRSGSSARTGDTAAVVGLGVAAARSGDVAAAEVWYRAAADRGDVDAMFSLSALHQGARRASGGGTGPSPPARPTP
ncbi:hypothetical protein AB0G02_16710 [Actinosynnema sp. NPDC023658]|uniref:hypothetical protein n=1 Tax=Actinosynnema sp. NPDC023658 TaxID=3155465 RepID=UPI0033E2D328